MFKKFVSLIFGISLFVFPSISHGEIKVITTTTDLAWAAKEIAGEKVSVRSLLKGTENPHYVDTIPEFIRLVAEADVVCIVGLELEVGWVPKVLSRSGNSRVQPGGKGYCETGLGITPLDTVSGRVDRSMGDIHPSGNPHFWLSPNYLAQGSSVIRDTLIRIDPQNAGQYEKNYQTLKTRLAESQKKNSLKLAGLSSEKPLVAEYHKEFTYFFEAYGLKSFGSIEEKPGVSPSAGRIADFATKAKASGIKTCLGGTYAPHKTLEKFSELSGIKCLVLPTSVERDGQIKDYFELQNHLVDAVVSALRK